MTIRTKASSN